MFMFMGSGFSPARPHGKGISPASSPLRCSCHLCMELGPSALDLLREAGHSWRSEAHVGLCPLQWLWQRPVASTMGTKLLVLDFDGTMTDAEVRGAAQQLATLRFCQLSWQMMENAVLFPSSDFDGMRATVALPEREGGQEQRVREERRDKGWRGETR